MTNMPDDADGDPIPVLRLRDGAAHTVAIGATAARNGTAFNEKTRVISLYAELDVWLKFGGETVTATAADHFFPAGIYYDLAIGGAGVSQTPFLSVLRVAGSGTGNVYISEKM